MGFRLAAVPLALVLAGAAACTLPPAQPDTAGNSQRLPFESQRPATTSFSRSLVPPTMIPEGTFLIVRLSNPLSSASARAGDSFGGALDDPIVVDQQILLPRGAKVSGRVLDAKPSAGVNSPGYLRLTLVSVNTAGKTVLIDTSSIFTKATPRIDPRSAPPAAAPNPSAASNDILFSPDRRLTFRLAQAVDLQ